MRINEFNNIQEFIDMYDENSTVDCEKHIGLEFEYHKQMYRMCREPKIVCGKYVLPTLPNGKIGRYAVYKVFNHMQPNQEYETIGWYTDMDDLLNNCFIEGKPFKEVIMEDDTRMDGMD